MKWVCPNFRRVVERLVDCRIQETGGIRGHGELIGRGWIWTHHWRSHETSADGSCSTACDERTNEWRKQSQSPPFFLQKGADNKHLYEVLSMKIWFTPTWDWPRKKLKKTRSNRTMFYLFDRIFEIIFRKYTSIHCFFAYELICCQTLMKHTFYIKWPMVTMIFPVLLSFHIQQPASRTVQNQTTSWVRQTGLACQKHKPPETTPFIDISNFKRYTKTIQVWLVRKHIHREYRSIELHLVHLTLHIFG